MSHFSQAPVLQLSAGKKVAGQGCGCSCLCPGKPELFPASSLPLITLKGGQGADRYLITAESPGELWQSGSCIPIPRGQLR